MKRILGRNRWILGVVVLVVVSGIGSGVLLLRPAKAQERNRFFDVFLGGPVGITRGETTRTSFFLPAVQRPERGGDRWAAVPSPGLCGGVPRGTGIGAPQQTFLDIGGSFAEFHPVDFQRDSVLVGHDGPHHLNIADGKPVLRSLSKYHGKPGSGASVEFRIKEGPITMLSIGVTAEGKFTFIIAEGESLRGPIPPTGNTNTHGRFKPDVRTFLKRWVAEGPTHRFALGVGHHAATIKKIANCLGIEAVVVTEELSMNPTVHHTA